MAAGVDLITHYSNRLDVLADLREVQRQLGRAQATTDATGRHSVRSLPPPARERKQWVKRPPLTEQFTPKQLARIIRDTQTMTQAAVAEKYGISEVSVWRLVKKHKGK
ncbi:hypothetical protein G3I59_02965 [Amycolatopsis rubida]|uniref:Uncharacterized protein n=1 Tax=Amycolatopsis rubida TaxID=112413 RepID=A0ABX0BM34_9PSEU|nr:MULTISPECIES: hypothetical protein [Amycolatopsis]MYW89611.1 hypothetical protein [Amycolatopsis rubida]NEC54588.1 hypothetical protein [Amycolatopsis rubida]OAP25661.1 hypothetical protein A4R44_03035 [Amycolatopsis sp. M39]